MTDINWDKFHDWVIGTITIDWVGGIMKIRLSQVTVYEIEVLNLRSTSLSRLLPWGMSQHVNNIQCKKNKLDNWEIEIEMQSGDILKIEGEQINVIE